MPMVSVIVPVYKVEPYIHQCVDSILAQTYPDFELILVDDGSPDNCGKICDEYANQDSRIHVIHQENGGLSAARNAGIDAAKGEYITFVDSDDFIHPQLIRQLFDAVIKYHVDVSVCTFERFDRLTEIKIDQLNCNEAEVMTAENLLVFHEWNYNYAWGKMYKKKLFDGIRYPVGKNFEDVFTTYRILFAAEKEKIAWLKQPLYFYYINYNGITRSPWTPGELTVFQGMQEQIDFYRDRGYNRALDKEMYLYVNHFAYQICRIRENKKDFRKNKKYMNRLRYKMMHTVLKEPKRYGYKKMPQCFEAAFPRTMKILHKCMRIIRLMFRKVRKNT